MRRPRLDLPGLPVHVTHRGNNRAATFADGDHCQAYLHSLREACGTTAWPCTATC